MVVVERKNGIIINYNDLTRRVYMRIIINKEINIPKNNLKKYLIDKTLIIYKVLFLIIYTLSLSC